jgi:uncharacterized membrane-anchored protein YitT (DUF2179 family)
MQNKKEALSKIIKQYIFMVLGCICYSLSLRVFLIPNNIVGGGVSGAASLIQITTGLSAGLFIVLINVPILILGFRLMGKNFIFRCLITTLTLGLLTEVFAHIPTITGNDILAAVYGGILQGTGIGLFIKYEMSSGGTELLGRITHHALPFFSIPMHVAVFDGLVVILGAFIMKNPENVLYALILIFVSAKVSDLIILGLSKAKLCYIITEKAEEISAFLLSSSPRGITFIQGKGMYTKTQKGVLLTCIKNNQISFLKASVKRLDEGAFVIVCDANEVYGKGFRQF